MICCLILTGCGKKDEKTVLKNFEDKVNNTDSYYLSGKMELVNNEDVYSYNISVSYAKDDYYKIELTNVISDHKQVILRNDEGVYVITPSLNKSFKFQSDWPYNNSQVYLLASLLDDIKNDEERVFERSDEGYIFTSSVNYPNNSKLVNQKVYFDNDYLPKRVEVMDKEGTAQIKMLFEKIDLRTEFNDTYFDLNSILTIEGNENKDLAQSNDNSENKVTDDNQQAKNEKNKIDDKSKETATIDDIIYPMYLPVNTYLTNQERVSTDDGERLILTFTGDSSFVLVEETANYSNKPEIITTSGDVELIGPSLAVINDNSANWFNNGIEYYVVSNAMSSSELLQVVRSISVLPVSK